MKLTNYRRFAGVQSLDLSESVIALVGPNEAGKSSILSALELVGLQKPPNPGDRARGGEGPVAIGALFALDPEDHEALRAVDGGNKVRRAWVTWSTARKGTTWSLEPHVRRDIRRRASLMDALVSIKWYKMPQELRKEVSAILSSTEDAFTNKEVSALKSAAHYLAEFSSPQVDEVEDASRIAASLVDLIEFEGHPTPWRQIVDVLAKRVPEVAFFSPGDRELKSTYNIDGLATNPSPALQNVCAVGGLSLTALENAVKSQNAGRAEKLLETANAKLKAAFREVWRQSSIYPRLSGAIDGTLRLFVATEEGDYTIPEEHSDGMRWFLALHAFLTARGQRDPILVVDEAETHLHYDAQADLVDALMNQQIARQVIYTTHSVGCLPPDLGCGIRVAVPVQGAERSIIVNSYWSVGADSVGKVGYQPLLLAMGARLLALTVPRFGVLVEGPSDAILLPSLLREATGIDNLPYRVAPGLSEIASQDADSVPSHGGKVACLLDGDDGGKAISDKLRSAGIPENLILSLKSVKDGCTLEDLVDAEVFSAAINAEMDMWGISPLRIMPTDLPDTGRWAWLEQKGEQTGTPVKRLSKTHVAQRIVDVGREARFTDNAVRLLGPDASEPLREVHQRLCRELGVKL